MLTKKAKLEQFDSLEKERNLLQRYFWDTCEGIPATARADTNVSPMQFLRHELEASHNAKLRHDGNDRYSVNIHSNLWYEFESETSRGE